MIIQEDALDENKPLKALKLSESKTRKVEFENYKTLQSTGEPAKKMITRKERLCLFVLLTYGIVIFGISAASFGLSIIDFATNMDVTVGDVTYGLSVISMFACIGSLLTFYTLDRFNRQLQLALFSLFFAFVTICYPFITNFKFYLFVQALNGICVTYINSISNVWVVELFQGHNPSSYLQTMHFFFTIGEFITPLFFGPFLRNTRSVNATTDTNTTAAPLAHSTDRVLQSLEDANQDAGNLFSNLFQTTKHSDLWIPYMILSFLKISICALIYIAYCIKPYKKSEVNEDAQSDYDSKSKTTADDSLPSYKENCDPYKQSDADQQCTEILNENRTKLSRKYFFVFMLLVCIIAGIQLANELNATSLLPTYLVQSDLKLSKETASYSQAVLSASILIGRGVNIFLTLFINVPTMIFINYVCMILGNYIILVYGNVSLLVVNTGIAITGYGFSNVYPMFLSYVDQRVKLKNKYISFIFFTGGIFQAVIPAILGKFLATRPTYFIIMNIAITSFAFAVYLLLLLLEGVRLSIFASIGSKIRSKFTSS